MDASRKANRADNEITLQYQSRRDTLLVEELAAERLAELQMAIEQSRQSTDGASEIQRRIKLLGECNRIEGETSAQFYARLRQWWDRDLPQAKSPLHAPRQQAGE